MKLILTLSACDCAESSHLTVGGSKKRAASTSPARNEFRRSLKERLPRQIRTFIDARTGRSRAPTKPSRKAGPIGRTWVKVCDDITYMDDASEEYYPVVAYSGSPLRVPEADPLPRPPTPPPAKSSVRKVSPTPSQKSEYDNVQVEEQSPVKKAKLSDEELILSEITNQMEKTINQKEAASKKRLSDQELIMQELTTKQKKEESIRTETSPERPPARRSREPNRFKNRKQKRSGTPIALDRLTNGFSDEVSEPVEMAATASTISSQPEDDYIIPERSVPFPPSRPARGNKLYETIEQQKPEEKETAASTDSPKEKSEPLFKEKDGKEEPMRPVRGVKVYESIILKNTTQKQEEEKEDENIQKTEESVEVKSDISANSAEQTMSEQPIETSAPSTTVEEPATDKEPEKIEEMDTEISLPEKPKRGIKVYEDVLLKKENAKLEASAKVGEAQENVPEKPKRGIKVYEDVIPVMQQEKKVEDTQETEEVKQTSTSVPNKPARGNKIYSSVNITEDIKKKDYKIENNIETEVNSEQVSNERHPSSDEKTEEDNTLFVSDKAVGLPSTETLVKDETKKEENIPPYATVQKGKDNQLTDASLENSLPPPIPPKKRTRHAALSPDRDSNNAPPKPARHLKPRSKSSDMQNQAKRQKTDGKNLINSEVPIKPLRSTTGKSSTLPRRKKAPRAEPLIAKMSIETGKATEITIVPDSESYENVLLQDHKVPYRSRPLPPPPSSAQSNENESTPVLAVTSPEGTVANELSDSSTVAATQGAESDGKGNSSISTAGDAVESGGVTDVSEAKDSHQDNCVGGLDQDIDSNLRNIETSFATLDSVLKSLKSYSETTPGKVISVVTSSDNGKQDERTNEGDVSSQPPADNEKIINVEASIKFNPNQSSTEVSIDVVKTVEETKNVISGEEVRHDANKEQFGESSDPAMKQFVDVNNSQTCESVSCNQLEEIKSPIDSSAISSAIDKSEQLVTNSKSDVNIIPISESRNETNFACPVLVDSSDKLSLAAENVSSENNDDTVILESSAVSFSENNIPEPVSISSAQVDAPRKLSIAAENVASLDGETCSNSESNSLSNVVTIVEGTSPKSVENERKISIAAETVVSELMTETTGSLAVSSPTQTASVAKSDVTDAVSVADISVTSGQFADTVINTSNEIIKATIEKEKTEIKDNSEVSIKSKEDITQETNSALPLISSSDSEITEPIAQQSTQELSMKTDSISNEADQQFDKIEQLDTDSLSTMISDSIPLGGEAESDNQKSASNSLEGSVTSITDDDSVVSVVTKEDLIEKDEGGNAETEVSDNKGLIDEVSESGGKDLMQNTSDIDTSAMETNILLNPSDSIQSKSERIDEDLTSQEKDDTVAEVESSLLSSDEQKIVSNSADTDVTTSNTDNDSVVSVAAKEDLVCKTDEADIDADNEKELQDQALAEESEGLTQTVTAESTIEQTNETVVSENESATCDSNEIESFSATGENSVKLAESKESGNDECNEPKEKNIPDISVKPGEEHNTASFASNSETELITATEVDSKEETESALSVDDITGGVASISSRLEGISTFLDTLVRSFSSPAQSGPTEENCADVSLSTPQCSVSEPLNQSTDALMLPSKECINEKPCPSLSNKEEPIVISDSLNIQADSSLPDIEIVPINLVSDKVELPQGVQLEYQNLVNNIGASPGAIQSKTNSCPSSSIDSGTADSSTIIVASGQLGSSPVQSVSVDISTEHPNENKSLLNNLDIKKDSNNDRDDNVSEKHTDILDDANVLTVNENIDCISRDFSKSVNETDSPPHSAVDSDLGSGNELGERRSIDSPKENSSTRTRVNDGTVCDAPGEIPNISDKTASNRSETPEKILADSFSSDMPIPKTGDKSDHEPTEVSAFSKQTDVPPITTSGIEGENLNETGSFPIEKKSVESDAISLTSIYDSSCKPSGSSAVISLESDALNVTIEVPEVTCEELTSSTVGTDLKPDPNNSEIVSLISLGNHYSPSSKKEVTNNVLDSENVHCTLETAAALSSEAEGTNLKEIKGSTSTDKAVASIESLEGKVNDESTASGVHIEETAFNVLLPVAATGNILSNATDDNIINKIINTDDDSSTTLVDTEENVKHNYQANSTNVSLKTADKSSLTSDSELSTVDNISATDSASVTSATVTDILRALQREAPAQNDGYIGIFIDGEWVNLT